MRKMMVFQHVGHEPLGTLDPMLKAAGFRIRYVNFGRDPGQTPSLQGYNGLIVLGGPMGVYEADQYPHLKTEMKLIEEAVKRGIPVLGICLGAQLIAQVLGAVVRKGGAREVGWCPIDVTEAAAQDPLFQFYQPTEKVFQIHQDTFDIPPGAIQLARSSLFEGQAFRYGDRVYGLQFHLEADERMIHRWLNRAEYRQWIDDSIGLHAMEAETGARIARSLELSAQTFGRFIEIFQLPERAQRLGSEHGRPPKGQL